MIRQVIFNEQKNKEWNWHCDTCFSFDFLLLTRCTAHLLDCNYFI